MSELELKESVSELKKRDIKLKLKR